MTTNKVTQEPRFARLHVWAQDYITSLQYRLDTAVDEIKALSGVTDSPVYVEGPMALDTGRIHLPNRAVVFRTGQGDIRVQLGTRRSNHPLNDGVTVQADGLVSILPQAANAFFIHLTPRQ